MANPWKRFRDYMDELEEAMRMAGVELEDIRDESAERNELAEWRQTQRDAVDAQLLARARDIPFLSELVRIAAEQGPDSELPAAPDELAPWEERQHDHHIDSAERATPLPDAGSDDPAVLAPARLRNAERALAHRTRSLIPVLEELVTPRNASAIVRSAEALGLHEIHFVDPRGRVRLNRAVTRKCQQWMDLRWHRGPVELVGELRRRGYTILAADFGPESLPLEQVPVDGPIAVVFGSEQRGVSVEMREAADGLFHLPTSGYTSYLNVSVTAGIALHDLDRRLREVGSRNPLPADEVPAIRRAWYAMLAGENEEKRMEYAAWAERPPAAAELLKSIPSREKRREKDERRSTNPGSH